MANARHHNPDYSEIVRLIMGYYKGNPCAPKWSAERRRFTRAEANSFFIGVLLDQGQNAQRAWDAGRYLVEYYFAETENFWHEISTTNLNTMKSICRTGYNGKAFALHYQVNRFPRDLKSVARKIVRDYDSDVRNIWNGIKTKNVDDIYLTFKEFDGIGDALAKMAQFILVRDYGIAGGKRAKRYMSVKPDVHLRRVLFRLGIAEHQTPRSTIDAAERLHLKSPADFDWAVWTIGREYCRPKNPICEECPLESSCQRVGI